MSEGDIQYSFERSQPWHIKLHLQGTGWLQYIPPFILGSLILLASRTLSYFHNSAMTASALSSVGKLIWTVGIVDVITLKFNLRPPEPLPKRPGDDCDACSIVLQRRSCRSFQPRKLRKEDLKEILDIARIESKQTIGSESIRFEYVDSLLKVWPIINAQEFLVAIGPARSYDRMAMIDVGRSLQAVVLHATKLGVATCWIGPGCDHLSIKDALESRGKYDSERDHIICVCAIGYRSALVPMTLRLTINFLSRRRKPREELFFADHTFHTTLNTKKHPFDKYENCYEAARWSPSSYNAQPTKCVGSWDKATDTVRFDFYSATKSRYYAPIATGIWLRDWEAACDSIGVKGRFAVLTDKERGIDNVDDLPQLPVYNISWIRMESKQ